MEPSKKRKRRTSFTPQALELLNAHFERNTHPSGKYRHENRMSGGNTNKLQNKDLSLVMSIILLPLGIGINSALFMYLSVGISIQ